MNLDVSAVVALEGKTAKKRGKQLDGAIYGARVGGINGGFHYGNMLIMCYGVSRVYDTGEVGKISNFRFLMCSLYGGTWWIWFRMSLVIPFLHLVFCCSSHLYGFQSLAFWLL